MLFVKTRDQKGVLLSFVHLPLSVPFYFFEGIWRENLQVDKQRRKANFSMQMERYDSHRAEKIAWCSTNKGLPIQPRKYFPFMVFDGW